MHDHKRYLLETMELFNNIVLNSSTVSNGTVPLFRVSIETMELFKFSLTL